VYGILTPKNMNIIFQIHISKNVHNTTHHSKLTLTSKQSSFADTGSAVINLNVTDKDKA
jgi:hypothetical protein